MDRNRIWMYGSRLTFDYRNVVEKFLEFAFQHAGRWGEILFHVRDAPTYCGESEVLFMSIL